MLGSGVVTVTIARQLRPLLNGEPNESLTCSPLSWHHPRIRWFLVTNTFKTVLVAIGLWMRDDPQSQGVASLVLVLMMLAATLRTAGFSACTRI